MHSNPDRLTHMEYIKARKSKIKQAAPGRLWGAEITGLTESLISKQTPIQRKMFCILSSFYTYGLGSSFSSFEPLCACRAHQRILPG